MKDRFARAWPRVFRGFQHIWKVFWRTIVKYDETDGEQRAASFAYYAFFSLFPLLLFFVSIGTMFMGDQERATQDITKFVGEYIPLEPGQTNWFVKTVETVVHSRNNAINIAFVLLVWSAIRFFQALVRGVNKAWGTKEYSWWRLPIKNFFMVGIVASALFLGVFTPPTIDLLEYYIGSAIIGGDPSTATINAYWTDVGLNFKVLRGIFWFSRKIVPTLVLFYGFAMFYRFAPRRRTKFREIWVAAVVVTVGLQLLQYLFVIYVTRIGDFRLYGTLASVVALLMWIYLSGSIIIFGGCLCAAQYEVGMHITDQSESGTA